MTARRSLRLCSARSFSSFVLFCLAFLTPCAFSETPAETVPAGGTPVKAIRVGWIGAMTGPVSKYAAQQSALLATEQINAAGGINGRPLELLFQDGKCQAKDAIDGANALFSKEGVRLILGGHCSTESLAIAPIVERSGGLMLASISSSPKLSGIGKHVFRVTAPNLRGIELLVPYILTKRNERAIAVVSEETEYAQGMAEYFSTLVKDKGGSVPASITFKMGEADFLSFATRIKSSHADALYLSVQSPDSAILFLQKMHQLGVTIPVFGNEISGNAIQSASPDQAGAFEGLVFSEPALAPDDQVALQFAADYKKRFNVEKLSNGFWSAEAFDAVKVLAAAIKKCGEEPDAVSRCLTETKDYHGASGSISFDANGDGVRSYVLKKVSKGILHELELKEPNA